MGSIEFRGVYKRYPNGLEALKNISIGFEEGSMTFLTGHSGAGKTTFLKLLLCLDSPSMGQIEVNGVNISTLDSDRRAQYRRNLGVVFQDHHLLNGRTAFENVALPLRVAGLREREVGRRVRAALSRVGLLEREAALPGRLSAGEQQRVGIARAIVSRPKLLLADEPTGNLDPNLSHSIMDLFTEFNQVGTTVIVASHDLNLVSSMGKRLVALHRGDLVASAA